MPSFVPFPGEDRNYKEKGRNTCLWNGWNQKKVDSGFTVVTEQGIHVRLC